MSDIWDRAIDRSLARTSFANTLDDRDPTQVRKANRIGQEIGVPGSVVEADLDGFQREADAENTKTLFDYAPGLAAFSSDPANAAAIKDDLEPLSKISKTFGTAEQNDDPLGRNYMRALRSQSRSTSILTSLGIEQPAETRAERTERMRRNPEQFSAGQRRISTWEGYARTIDHLITTTEQGAAGFLADAVGVGDQYRDSEYYAGLSIQAGRLAQVADAPFQQMEGQYLGQQAYRANQSLTLLGASLATGNPLATFGLTTGLSDYERFRQRGAGANEAALGGALTGGIEVATELLPIKWLTQSFGRGAAGSFLKKYLLAEVGGELAATAGQSYVDALVTGGKGLERFKEDLPQELLDTAVSTAFMTSAIGGASGIARRLAPQVREQEDVGVALAGAQFLDQVMANAEKSKLRAEDPARLRDLVERHAENTPVRNVYIPVEAVATYMQSEGYEAGQLEQFQDQIDEAQATSGDVVIPIADAAAYLAGTPAWEALKEEARVTPGGFSQKEAREKSDELFQELEKQGAELAKESAAAGVERSAVEETFTEIKNVMLAAGMESKHAEAAARIAAERYATRGAKRGQSPLEAWKASGVSILGVEDSGAVKGRVMAQSVELNRDLALDEQEDIAHFIADQIEDGDATQIAAQLFEGGGLGLGIEEVQLDPAEIATSKQTSKRAVISYTKQSGSTAPRMLVEKRDGKWHLIEGGHRHAAALARGDKTVRALDVTGMRGDWAAWLDGDDAAVPGARIMFQSDVFISNPDGTIGEERTLNQEDVFYSALERAIRGSKTTKAPGAQWIATLRKTPGVKQEELEWSGILDYLEATTGPITREALAEVMANGGIQVEEVMLGEDGRFDADMLEEEIDNVLADFPEMSRSQAESAAESNLAARGAAGADRVTQFSSWSSDQSNDTYRELLITLPVATGGNPTRAPATHWDQEGVVAHARFMDKTDADGKRVLFIEEVQSDWHQKGRDQGHEAQASPEQKAKIDAAQRGVHEVQTALDEVTKELREREIELNKLAEPIIIKAHEASLVEIAERAKVNPALNQVAIDAYSEVMGRNSGYNFFKSRGEESGYVGLSDLEGWLENARGNLERTTEDKTVDVFPEKLTFALAEAVSLRTEKRNLSETLSLRQREVDVARQGSERGIPNAPFKSSWPALVMKRMIRYAAENGYERIAWTTGTEQQERYDLESGEGMKAFYDRNLVNITNDIIKKHGVKVGKLSVLSAEQQRILNTLPEIYSKATPGYADERRQDVLKAAMRPGFDITPSLADAAMQGLPLFQKNRGSVTFAKDGNVIKLFEDADFSTIVHELSHVWLEELRADAMAEDATEPEIDDWTTVRGWFAKHGIKVGDRGTIPTQAHELWARGGERYVMEGKAPSNALVKVFGQFRNWLQTIYKSVADLRSSITPEVREVFDRLLATQDAIDEQRRIEGIAPLFKSAEDAGMTDAEFAAYMATSEASRDAAYNTLLEKTMEAIRRKRLAAQREQRANVKDVVATAINAQPMFIALNLLRTGRWLGDPEREKQDVKLNSGWLIDTFGEDILTKLPKGLPITRGDGLDGDVVAEMVGMSSGQELVHALVGQRAASEQLRATGEKRYLRDKMIDDEVDRVMAERHGDALTDGTIEEEAIAALNTAAQGEILSAEIRQLGKRTSVEGRVTPYQFVREWAKRKISAGHVKDVASRSAMQRYTRATSKAARLAEEAILKGDMDEAYRQKQAQLLNHALLAESKAAADRVDTIVERMKRLAKRAAMKSVDQDYMDKIHALLENYDFRARSQKSIDEQEGFQEWMEAQRAKGYEVHIPPRLANNGDPYSRVSVEELEALNDVVQSLLHLGRTKQKIVSARAERDFAEWRDEVVARIEQLPDRKLPAKPINEEARIGASIAAELLKVEQIVEELDGGPTGPLHDMIILGATTAENKRHALRDKVMAPLVAAYHGLSRKQWKRLQEKITVNELTWNTLNEGDPRQGTTVVVTRLELMSIGMNMGNLSNLEKLSKGERWPVETLRAVMDRELAKQDWDFMQSLWTQVELLWPEIVASERAMSGVVPEKVVNNPIETKFGTYEGGYWPVVYDASRWQRAEDLEGKKLDDMFGLKSGIATQKGHTIERTAAFGPLSYSLENILFQHIEQVVTRIAFAPYARDVLRAIHDKRIRGMIDTKLGPEYRKHIEPWLRRQINEGAVDARGARWGEKIFKQARINITMAAMALRISTGIAQSYGLAASAQRLGGGDVVAGGYWVGIGMKQFATEQDKARQFVFDRSPEMLRRNGQVNREVSEVFNKLRGKHGWYAEAQAMGFWHIGMVDRYVVAIPTWLGAHAKGISEEMTDEEASAFADKTVRMSQGAGPEKDLASFQSANRGQTVKFLTMFYSPFNVMFNAQWNAVRQAKRGRLGPAIGVTFWWLIVSMLGDALLSNDAPDWEDEESVLGWFARNVAFGMFAGIPLVRDYASYKERKISGQYASDPGMTPPQKVYEAIEKTYTIGKKVVEEGEGPNFKQANDAAGPIFGLPTQPGTTAQFLWDYSEGEADPQGVSDWYFGLTKGKVPDKQE